MSWTVLSVAYPFATVGDNSVGGAEQVLATLDRALVQAGHRSIVLAPEGSQVNGVLVASPSIPALIDDANRARVHRSVCHLISQVLETEKVDLIHLHGIDFSEYLPAPGVPVLATLHLPLAWYPPEIFAPRRPGTWLHCVSENQQIDAPPSARSLPPIPNGVDLDRYRPLGRKRRFALMLCRICPEKGVDIALRACREASIPLLIGGAVYPYPAHRAYFDEQVTPLLDGCRRFLGPLQSDRKASLLAAASCLLAPSTARETSSLVAMEALASGTPVVAFRSGALTEIVDHGKTGFLVNTERDLTEALQHVSELSPAECRKSAIARFDVQQTINGYFETYAHLVCEKT